MLVRSAQKGYVTLFTYYHVYSNNTTVVIQIIRQHYRKSNKGCDFGAFFMCLLGTANFKCITFYSVIVETINLLFSFFKGSWGRRLQFIGMLYDILRMTLTVVTKNKTNIYPLLLRALCTSLLGGVVGRWVDSPRFPLGFFVAL